MILYPIYKIFSVDPVDFGILINEQATMYTMNVGEHSRRIEDERSQQNINQTNNFYIEAVIKSKDTARSSNRRTKSDAVAAKKNYPLLNRWSEGENGTK